MGRNPHKDVNSKRVGAMFKVKTGYRPSPFPTDTAFWTVCPRHLAGGLAELVLDN